jgi:hypothetical protein
MTDLEAENKNQTLLRSYIMCMSCKGVGTSWAGMQRTSCYKCKGSGKLVTSTDIVCRCSVPFQMAID